MTHGYSGRAFGAALLAEGLIPSNARSAELHIHADGAVILRYDVIVDESDLGKLARAIARLTAPAPVLVVEGAP